MNHFRHFSKEMFNEDEMAIEDLGRNAITSLPKKLTHKLDYHQSERLK